MTDWFACELEKDLIFANYVKKKDKKGKRAENYTSNERGGDWNENEWGGGWGWWNEDYGDAEDLPEDIELSEDGPNTPFMFLKCVLSCV